MQSAISDQTEVYGWWNMKMETCIYVDDVNKLIDIFSHSSTINVTGMLRKSFSLQSHYLGLILLLIIPLEPQCVIV